MVYPGTGSRETGGCGSLTVFRASCWAPLLNVAAPWAFLAFGGWALLGGGRLETEALSVPSVSMGAGTGLWNAVLIFLRTTLTPSSGMSEGVFPGVARVVGWVGHLSGHSTGSHRRASAGSKKGQCRMLLMEVRQEDDRGRPSHLAKGWSLTSHWAPGAL